MSCLARTLRRSLVIPLLPGLFAVGILAPAQVAIAAVMPVVTTAPAAAAPTWRVLASTDTSVRLELVIPELQRRDMDDGSAVLSIPGGAELGADGAPALPTVSRLVAIPSNARVTGAVLDWEASTLVRLDLAPNRDDDDAPFTRDASAYAREGWQAPSFLAGATMFVPVIEKSASPAPVVVVGAPAIMAGQSVVPLTVAPVLYDAAAKRASACGRVVVELRFDTSGVKTAVRERPLTRSFAALAGDQVLNLPREKTLPVAGAQPGLWVAVARNNPTVLAKLQPLIDWRKRQGYSVEVVDADAAGNTTTGIKAALQAIYDDPARPPLEFVVLVGDGGPATASSVPTWYESVSGYNGEGDHYYSLLDGADILADVHIGRLSFSNSSLNQLDIIVSKILNYEQSPPMDNTDWYGRACLMGDPSQSGITTIWVNQWLKTQLLDLGWSKVDTVWSGNFRSIMTASLTPGASVCAYRGFLGMSGIAAADIDILTNGGRLPVALLPTCDTGSFSSTNESRSEAWLRAPNGGGIAAVGTATIHTHTRYNNAYFMGAWDGLLHGDDHRVGTGHTAGKTGLYTNYYVGEPGPAEIWSVWNNLMGDPATDMWIGVPRALTVTAPAALASGAATIPVTVMNGFVPVAGALVCAMDAGGACLRGVTDYLGQVTLSGKPPVDGALKLTVSGHGLLPYLGNITVSPAATFCGLTGVQFIDDGSLGSSGNGDGQVSPGETVAVLPTLTNSGTNTASGVTAELTGGAPWVALTGGGSLTFGDLNASQAVAAAQPVLVTVAADAPAGQSVPLALNATDGVQTWLSTVEMEIKAPKYTVTGVAFGGPGGSCDPGESGALVVTLRNDGSLAAGGVTATLTTTSPWLSIADPYGSFPGVTPGSSVTNTAQSFAVYANSDCFAGHLAVCTLALTSDGVMLSETEFTLIVGTQSSNAPSGPDHYGYYAFDDTDTASGKAPVYDWVGIAPDEGGSGSDVGLADFGWEQDDTKTVDLPFSFRYYGKDFSRISICSNGWVALGDCSLVSYHNQGIPGAAGTPRGLIAPFWDNLEQSGANRVYQWHDAAGHRYIVEWHRLVNDQTGTVDDFQLILLDPLFHQTTSGEGMIIFQYKSVFDDDDRNAYATVGIQSPDGDDGILYSYWDHIMGGAAPLQTGRAILFMPLGELVLPAMQVSPASLTVSAVPGGQATREVQVSNLGDVGSLLRVQVTAVDPAVAAGKSARGGGDDPAVTPLGLTGSVLHADAVDYEAGSSVTLNLTINCLSQGQEWIRDVTFDAPPGVIVTGSTQWSGPHGTIPSNNATGDGALVYWTGGGYLDNGNTGTATVNVTFSPALEGDATFNWILQGDNWGDPPHTITGQVVLASRGPSIHVSAPATAAVAVLGQPLTVEFAAVNGPTQVSVELQREMDGPWEMLVASTPAAAGGWTWPAVTGAPGPYAQLRVRDVADPMTEGLSGVFVVSRDLSWLQPEALSLAVPAGATEPLGVTLEAAGLAEGVYEALLVIAGNGGPPVSVPVTFTVTGASAVGDAPLPAALALLGARPNPFNPRTVIRFAMPVAQYARLDVYTVRGQRVRRLVDGRVDAGVHDVVWDGRDDAGHDAASGVYFYRLSSGGQVLGGKMILAR